MLKILFFIFLSIIAPTLLVGAIIEKRKREAEKAKAAEAEKILTLRQYAVKIIEVKEEIVKNFPDMPAREKKQLESRLVAAKQSLKKGLVAEAVVLIEGVETEIKKFRNLRDKLQQKQIRERKVRGRKMTCRELQKTLKKIEEGYR